MICKKGAKIKVRQTREKSIDDEYLLLDQVIHVQFQFYNVLGNFRPNFSLCFFACLKISLISFDNVDKQDEK